jgi:hypothetical protein
MPVPLFSSSSSSSLGAGLVSLNVGGVRYCTNFATLCAQQHAPNYFTSRLQGKWADSATGKFTASPKLKHSKSEPSASSLKSLDEEEEDDECTSGAAEASDRRQQHQHASLDIFIDRDGTLFSHVLNYLRDGHLPFLSCVSRMHFPFLSVLQNEAHFYRLDAMAAALAHAMEDVETQEKEKETKEKEWKLYMEMLIRQSHAGNDTAKTQSQQPLTPATAANAANGAPGSAASASHVGPSAHTHGQALPPSAISYRARAVAGGVERGAAASGSSGSGGAPAHSATARGKCDPGCLCQRCRPALHPISQASPLAAFDSDEDIPRTAAVAAVPPAARPPISFAPKFEFTTSEAF